WKAALKTHALQTLRDWWPSPDRAKRLECVRFIGAFRSALDAALAPVRLILLPVAVGPRTGLEFPHGLDGLGTSSWDQHNGASFVTEGPAQFAHEKFPVGFGKQFIAVDEQQKGRRRLPDLRRIKEVQPVP